MTVSPTVYEPGDTFTVDGDQFQVVGIGTDRVCARNVDTNAMIFFTALDLLPEQSPGPAPVGFNPLDPAAAMLSVPEAQRPLVQFWIDHLDELESGVHPEHPTHRYPQYSPDRPRRDRITAKAEELSSIQWPDGRRRQVSARTIERKLRARRERGPAGLVSGHVTLAKPGGNQDPEFIAVLDDILASYTTLTDVTTSVLFGRTRLAFRDKHPEYDYTDSSSPNFYRFPSLSTVNRLINRRGQHLLVDKPARRRRSAANTPKTSHRPALTARPGAEVQADTTVLDVWCLNDAGDAVRPRLSTMIDKHTRMLTSWIITLSEPTAQDLAIMLVESLVPYPLVDGIGDRFRLVNSRLPGRQMIDLEKRCAAAQCRPLIPPERLVLDNGAAYKSGLFADITAEFGISVTFCNPRSPWEKGIQERLFKTISTSFSSYFWSYLGVSAEHRGAFAATQLSVFDDMVRELFAEWALLIYHNRPHSSLCDPTTPRRKLSPIQAYAASLAYAPRFAVPITSRMLYRAYPVRWQKISPDGIHLAHRVYDSTDRAFNELRNKPSGIVAHGDLWEIRYSPHNRACVWVHNAATDEWLTVPCVRYREADMPCSAQRWRTDLANDPDLHSNTEELNARIGAASRLLSRKQAVRRDRKRLHESTHLPMPDAEDYIPGEQPDTPLDPDHTDSSDTGALSPGGYSVTNHSPWSV